MLVNLDWALIDKYKHPIYPTWMTHSQECRNVASLFPVMYQQWLHQRDVCWGGWLKDKVCLFWGGLKILKIIWKWQIYVTFFFLTRENSPLVSTLSISIPNSDNIGKCLANVQFCLSNVVIETAIIFQHCEENLLVMFQNLPVMS